MGSARLRLAAVAVLGLSAPLWWTWVVSNLAYGLYLGSGSPERPGQAFRWFLMLFPSLVLGAIAGVVVALLLRSAPMKGWLVFVGCLLVGSAVSGLLAGSGLAVLLTSPGSWAFLAGSIAVPLVVRLRAPRS